MQRRRSLFIEEGEQDEEQRKERAWGWWLCCCGNVSFLLTILFCCVVAAIVIPVTLTRPTNEFALIVTSIDTSTTTSTTTTTTSTTTGTTTSTPTTTSTTTTTTTTTSAAPTSPSAFSITCNASVVVVGDVEFNGPLDFYSVSGTGCGGSPITVSVQSNTVAYSKKKKESVGTTKRSTMTFQNNVTVMLTPPTVMTLDSNQTLTMQQVCDTFNVSFPGMHMHKRDLFTYPDTAFKQDVPVVGIIQTLNFQSALDELMSPSDNSPNYYLETNNMGGALAYFSSSQDYGLGFGAFFLHGIMQPQCVGGMGSAPTVPVGVRYDHEVGRFVVATLNPSTAYICFSLSSTENPLGSWTSYAVGPDAINFVYPSSTGFEFSIWGDHYVVCNGVTCIHFNRAVMLLSLPAQYVVMARSTLFPAQPSPAYPSPPVHVTNQDRDAPRTTPFMTVDAPCGVFSTIEAASGTLEVRLCQSIDYGTGITTYQSISMTTSPAWSSSVGQPCDCATLASVQKETYSNHVHSAYDKRGRMAWAWTSGAGTPTTSIAWAEMDTTTLVSGSPLGITLGTLVTPPLTALTGGNYFFVPSLLYDCWGTLFMTMTHATSDDNTLRPYTTYRLRSDPEGEMRYPPQPTSPLPTGADATGKPSNWGFSQMVLSTYTGVPRPVHILQPTDIGATGARIYVARQTHNITYVAQDACFTQSTCQQTIDLFTNGSCVSA